MRVVASLVVAFALRAASHRKIGRKWHGATVPAVDFRDRADHRGGVEHVIVEREIVRRDHADAELFLPRPIGGAKADTGFDQRLFVRDAGPEALQREFQFAARTDPRRAEGGDLK